MAKRPRITQDQKWEADSDARAMMEYVEIMKDTKRHQRALTALDRMEKEAKEAQLQRQVAKGLKKSFKSGN